MKPVVQIIVRNGQVTEVRSHIKQLDVEILDFDSRSDLDMARIEKQEEQGRNLSVLYQL